MGIPNNKKPKYDLSMIKQVFKTPDKLVMTYSAMQGQYELGFELYVKFQVDKRGEIIISFKAR